VQDHEHAAFPSPHQLTVDGSVSISREPFRKSSAMFPAGYDSPGMREQWGIEWSRLEAAVTSGDFEQDIVPVQV
jgi:hypothetical protein